jgi:hypothetical protein
MVTRPNRRGVLATIVAVASPVVLPEPSRLVRMINEMPMPTMQRLMTATRMTTARIERPS